MNKSTGQPSERIRKEVSEGKKEVNGIHPGVNGNPNALPGEVNEELED
jgi:hypothetical protein